MPSSRRSRAKQGCKDCPAGTKRMTPHPGPRCATHHRLVLAERRRAAHSRHIKKTYGITAEEYDAIYKAQGGACYMCQRAKGIRKRLPVDHDHACCAGPIGCRDCVRGLLCTRCNRLLGHLRDEIPAFERAIAYLTNPPARAVLSETRCGST